MSGNTNNTVFIQKLFTSRDNFVDGNSSAATANTANFVGQAGRIWWDPARNNFYSSDGNTPGGIVIGGGSGNGTVYGANTWVQYNNDGNFGASPSFTFDSSTNVLSATYFSGDGSNLTNVNLTGVAAGNTTEIQFNDNGNFSASGNLRFDTGSNTLYTDQIEIPTGTVLSGVGEVVYVIATLTLNQILANSNGSNTALPAGSYGNPNEVPAPWAVFQFTTDPSPAIEVNDILSGTGVPVPSSVTYVGTGGNSNIVVTTSTFYGLPTPLPTFGTPIPVSRQTLNAGLNISTQANTDIVMTPGEGGGIIWAGNLVPLTNDSFTLGSPTRRIKQSYFGSNTIYIYDNYLGIDQTIGANNGNLIIGGGAGLTVGNFIMSGNTLYLVNPSEDFNLGTIGATGNLTVNRRFNVNNSTGEWKLFDINPNGTATLISNVVTGSNVAAMEIIGATTRDINSPNNGGVLLHTSGTSLAPSRIYNDSYGNGNTRYSAYIGRHARGNALAPTGTLNNDIISRIGANPADSSNSFAPISTTRIDFVNSENQTPTSRGGRIEIWNTPVGSPTIALSTSFDTNGVSLIGNTTTTGITFADNTFQNTAFNDTSAVTSVTVGVGLTQTATVGDVGIDATGVQSITGTANRIIVTDLGGQNFNISTPQDLNTSSTLTFANLTITGNLTVNGTTTTANSANLDSKVLYLAANSTSNTQIDQGGIILGNNSSSYKVSILYDLPNNAWNTDGAGLTTLNLQAANANIDFLNVQNGGHFGLVNEQLDYPNAYVQVDANVNSYSQIVSQNHSPGTSASSDLVLVNDIGDDGNHYIDMGINGSNYTDPAFNSTTANDGYLFINQGNLVIGTDTTGEVVKFVAGGTTSDNVHLTISETDTTVKGNIIVTDGDDNTIFQMKTDGNLIWGGGSQGIRLNGGFYVSGVGSGDGLGNIITYNTSTGAMTYGPQLKDYSGNLKANNFTANTLAGNGSGLTNLNGANITGNINANLSGNGYQISNINSANIVGTVANANYAAYAGNVTNSLTINNSGTGSASGATFNGGSAITISYNTVGAPKADGTGASGTWGISITGNSNVANTANAVAGANVSGQVAYAAIANSVAGANVSGQVANALVAGTVYTNAQPNITSVGTLTTLTVAGNILGGNISASGMLSTGANIIALGNGAGISQGTWSVAVGYQAGTSNQGNYATAIGPYAGRYNQGDYTTALGQAAGLQSQGTGAIAIGQAGYESQGQYAIAIGSGAGDTMQGNNAIAIGYQAGGDHQTANSIILNASGAALETVGVAGLFINPVRNSLTSNANIVFFNTSTKELTYANTMSLAGNANVGNLGTGRVIATGNISGTQLISNIATGTAPLVVTSTTQVANLNVATAGLATFATTANAVAGANVSGQVSNALVAGTVYTNAQPNITSVGTLTGFTSNGVVNFANTSNVTLGAVANLHISGGSANNILLTNGSGNLSWASISTVNGVGVNQLVFVLNAAYSLTSLKNTLQSLFGLTNGVTLASNTRYQYELMFNMQFNKAGVLTYALALGSGVAVAQHNYQAEANQTNTLIGYGAGITMMSQNATGATITTGTAIGDTTNGYGHYIVRGTIDVTTGGNINFMISQDQNTPITWSTLTGSYITLMPLGAIGANTTAGTWS